MVFPYVRRPRQHGFTLMEITVVVAIIAISAALAVPAVAASMRERRAYYAMTDAWRLVSRARAEGKAYGRAHLVRYTKNVGITVYRGTSNLCNGITWGTGIIVAGGACTLATSYCIGTSNISDTTTVKVLSPVDASEYNSFDLCFEPSGRGGYRTTTTDGTRFTFSNTIGGGFHFVFQASRSGTPVGVEHRLVVPLSGPPGLWR